MPFVSVTRLRVRSILYLPRFLLYSLRSSRQAQRSPGYLGGRLMRDARNAFWTLTLWSDAQAMESFRVAGAHLAAMPRLLRWCDEASVVHWTQDSTILPPWVEAYERMLKQGRPSKVHRPSPSHLACEIPAPKPGRFSADLPPA